jgi:hypothetical protein
MSRLRIQMRRRRWGHLPEVREVDLEKGRRLIARGEAVLLEVLPLGSRDKAQGLGAEFKGAA